MSPPTVIVVSVNGTLSYVETANVQAATAGRRSLQDKPSKILTTLTYSLFPLPSLSLFPATIFSLYYRFTVYAGSPTSRHRKISRRNDSLKPSTNLSSFFAIKKGRWERSREVTERLRLTSGRENFAGISFYSAREKRLQPQRKTWNKSIYFFFSRPLWFGTNSH